MYDEIELWQEFRPAYLASGECFGVTEISEVFVISKDFYQQCYTANEFFAEDNIWYALYQQILN